jgi:bifunctional N-acetylglucosamine-1-phosphate-uridyltransferase/glucosamine-1-phosphate-acetyltransferase GlmU-like protein
VKPAVVIPGIHMKSDLSHILRPLMGRPLVTYAADTARARDLGPGRQGGQENAYER